MKGAKGIYIGRGPQFFGCRLIWVLPPSPVSQALPATQREERVRESKQARRIDGDGGGGEGELGLKKKTEFRKETAGLFYLLS